MKPQNKLTMAKNLLMEHPHGSAWEVLQTAEEITVTDRSGEHLNIFHSPEAIIDIVRGLRLYCFISLEKGHIAFIIYDISRH